MNVITLKQFPCHVPFVKGIHRRPMDTPHKNPAIRNFNIVFVVRLNMLNKEPICDDLKCQDAHTAALFLFMTHCPKACWCSLHDQLSDTARRIPQFTQLRSGLELAKSLKLN